MSFSSAIVGKHKAETPTILSCTCCHILNIHDVPNICHVPLLLRLALLRVARPPNLQEWTNRAETCDNLTNSVKIAMSAYEHADNIIFDILDWQATGKTIPLAVGFIGQVAATNAGGLVIDMTRQIKMGGRALCLLDILVKATDENETERNIEKKYLIC
ncbi:unnamed protein product [Lactuca saligna]|uniref:Uncharacterized protein n=1 Tax=Lactuca saligna TaxID=75948 RepID=A0AA36E6V5_LACSI|nr:unnamed protein product [Lactuca saligna]